MDGQDCHKPPDWRFRRARELIATGRAVSARRDDTVVRNLVGFLRKRTKSETEVDRRRLKRRMPELYAAFDIYEDPMPGVRDAIEARLLSGQSMAGIAKQVGPAATVIWLYGKSFFDVADRLDQADFIVRAVIGPPPESGGEASERWIWRVIGYFGGWSLLSQLMRNYGEQSSSNGLADMARSAASGARAIAMVKLRVSALLSACGDSRALGDILRSLAAYTKIVQGSPEEAQALVPHERIAQAMMGAIPWTVGSKAEEYKREHLSAFVGCAAEPRAADMLLYARGELSEERIKEIQDMRLPPPPKSRNRPGDQSSETAG